jgi:glycosyltransferase involved in cell wall biosynthesis
MEALAKTFASSISVVLCTYNGHRYLREQLDTIARQSRLPAELVVCDDQSTDETIAILREFASQAPFPVRISQNSVRLGSTRNFAQAIGLASGDLIALCDQDDRWAPDKLQILSDFLVENPSVGGVFSDAELIDENSKSVGVTLFMKHNFSPKRLQRFLSNPAATLLRHDVVTGSTLMFRTSLRGQSLPIPASWVHDGWLTWMITLYSQIALVTTPLTAYRIHAGQQLGAGARGSELKNETLREHYARVAVQFEDLLNKLLGDGRKEQDDLVVEVRRKIAFLKRQSALSTSTVVRTLQMIRLLPRYLHYARGFGSLRNDLLLGRGMS